MGRGFYNKRIRVELRMGLRRKGRIFKWCRMEVGGRIGFFGGLNVCDCVLLWVF